MLDGVLTTRPIAAGIRNRMVVHHQVRHQLCLLQYAMVPDRLLLDPESLSAWVLGQEFESLPALAVAVTERINDEVFPNWLRVCLWQRCEGTLVPVTIIEDCQPGKRRPSFIALVSLDPIASS